MNSIVHDAEETRRQTLALLLALGLHIALLLGIPAEGWSLRDSRSLRVDVALLPPVNRPHISAAAVAPEPVEAATGPGSSPAVVPPEPVLPPPLESPPVALPVPAPGSTPPPAPIPPPKPVAVARPAPKSTAPTVKPVKPAKPPAVANITPAPRTVVKPVALPKPAKPSASPVKPDIPARQTATAELAAKPPVLKPPPAPRFAPAETPRPVVEPPPASRTAQTGRGGRVSAGVGGGRLNSAALLGQIASLDAETQQQTSSSVRERRVSLADSRSLAGFYAADWARKVTRVGEMNFPDAARRLNLSAGPLLDVAIRADGSLRDVRVLRSSGNAELDQAARRIVQLAAPYPPFSPELRQQVELLRIQAPWRFDPGGRIQVR